MKPYCYHCHNKGYRIEQILFDRFETPCPWCQKPSKSKRLDTTMNPTTFDSIMKRFFERQSRRFLKDGIDASDLGAMSAIKNGAKTLEEIAVVVGWEDVVGKRQTIWYRLEKLEKQGWIFKRGHGVRELTPSGKARLASIERFLRKELCCGRKQNVPALPTASKKGTNL